MLKEQYKDLLLHNPYLSELYTYKTQRQQNLQLFNKLKEKHFDLFIDLHNNFRSAELKRILKAPSVSFKKKSLEKFLLVNFKINRLADSPQIPVRYAETLGNLTLDDEGLDLFLPGNVVPTLNVNENYIGIAPGSRHFTKMWPKEYYIELENILANNNYKVAVFGGKDDKQVCEEISTGVKGSINLCNEDNIFKTAVDMKQCRAVICNDSGLMHAACALKLPVLTFFGSTLKEFGFTPYKNKSIILENAGLSCRPCSHIGLGSCPKKHFNCMLYLTPQLAFTKLKLLLN